MVGPPGFEPGTVRSLAYRYEPAALSVLYGEVTWLSYGPSKNARPSQSTFNFAGKAEVYLSRSCVKVFLFPCPCFACESVLVGKRFNKRDLPLRFAAG